MKQIWVVDIAPTRRLMFDWPKIAEDQKVLTVAQRMQYAGLIKRGHRVFDCLKTTHGSDLLLPVSYINDQCVWLTDIDQSEYTGLTDKLKSIYPELAVSSCLNHWGVEEKAETVDCYELPLSVAQGDYAKRVLNAELLLYASDVNESRRSKGKVPVSAIREISASLGAVPNTKQTYSDINSLSSLFPRMKPVESWIEEPEAGVRLILDGQEAPLQKTRVHDNLIGLLNHNGCAVINIVDAQGVRSLANNLGSHFLSKARQKLSALVF